MSLSGLATGIARRIVPAAAVAGTAYTVAKSLAAFGGHDSQAKAASRGRERLYDTHIATTGMQKALIASGAALMAAGGPPDESHVAALGDATSNMFFDKMRRRMLSDPTGRRILRERPRVSFTEEQWEQLAQKPEGSFAHAYWRQMRRNNISWTTRSPVRFVDNEENAYMLQRHRECHDFYHTILDMDVSAVEELAIKIFEWRQTGLPVGLISSAFAPLRLSPAKRARFFKHYVPWALQCGSQAKPLISVYWEEMWDRSIDDIRKDMGVWLLPERNSITRAKKQTAAAASTET
ncbi:Ubiquinone biosynthesis protein [Coemansia sp. BCRC 34490]|nr:Ubiquinone biosynthesis protein [Coemansia sp. BCRC 34490]